MRTPENSDPLPLPLRRILEETSELQQAFLVGGCVRDWLWGLPCKDFDIEVFGVNYEQLHRALSHWGCTNLVGRSFGVVKLTLPSGEVYDFTLPRRDSKVAPGHRGFKIKFDIDISLREAAARRDYTINAMMYDPRERQVLDFFSGREDLRQRNLRPAGPGFTEDPLRILRGMQLAGRFGLRASSETRQAGLATRHQFGELAGERVREEWMKWAERSTVPSAGLDFLLDTGWIEHFPEVAALVGTPQDSEWHPEGDVYRHTCLCCDAMAGLPEWKKKDAATRVVCMFATLAHDFGKPATTITAVKRDVTHIISPGHDKLGGKLARQFLENIHVPQTIRNRVVPLVINHLAHLQTDTDRAVRRLAVRLKPETIENLCLVMTADQMGRGKEIPGRISYQIPRLRKHARDMALHDQAPTRLLTGKNLIEMGLKPGPQFSRILRAAFEAQLEGKFHTTEGAKAWLRQQFQNLGDIIHPPSQRQ